MARLIPIKLADEIRERYAPGVAGRGARSVARQYGVSVRTVQRVTHGTWTGGERRPTSTPRRPSGRLALTVRTVALCDD